MSVGASSLLAKEKRAKDARKYRKDNAEKVRAYDRRRWAQRRRYVRRRKQLGKRKCAFCGILLASKFVAMKNKKYCDGCRKDPAVRRYLRNLYQRRYQQRIAGGDIDSLTMSEDV